VPSGTLSWDVMAGAALSTVVDTSSAHLPASPLYFATLVDVAAIGAGPPVCGPLVELRAPTSTGFQLVVRAGALTPGGAASALTRMRTMLQAAGIVWHAALPSRGPSGGWS